MDSATYSDFRDYCDENAVMLSKKIEIFIRDFLKENQKHRTVKKT